MEIQKEQEKMQMEMDVKKDPYNHMMRILFCRWKPFILRAIFFDIETPTYFSRFLKQLPITQKELSRNLKELEGDGFIERVVIPQVPPRVEYRLTDVGQSLMPLLDLVYDTGWKDMKAKALPIDPLGEMWHGYREKDDAVMFQPYKKPVIKNNF